MINIKVKPKQQQQKINSNHLDSLKIEKSLDKNIQIINELFKDVDTLITRIIEPNQFICNSGASSQNKQKLQKDTKKTAEGSNTQNAAQNSSSFESQNDNSPNKPPKYFIAHIDGLVDSFLVNENIIKPLLLFDHINSQLNPVDYIMNSLILINEIKKVNTYKDVVESITYGDTLLLIDGCEEALILNTKHFNIRAIDEPENEKSLAGPREGFTESIITNLSMIQRKVRSNELKCKFYKVGRQTHTQICICYIESLVNKDVLNLLYKRLDKIDIDGILDSNYLTEFIKDNPYSPFRTSGYTERPDVVVGKLLEGRIAILVDGSPDAITVPYLFIENFQNSEDYYLNFYYTSFARILRYISFFLTVLVPAIYISLEAYHHEIIPTNLLVNMAIERTNVPLPAIVELVLLLLAFDILKETGIRMPSGVGQALSIVGALVIGQAAVDAKMIAAPMIIIVALTGITALLVPKMNAPIIYVRTFLLLLSAALGFVGFILGFAMVLTHLVNLHSFGISQFVSNRRLDMKTVKDIPIRAPWWKLKTRPFYLTHNVRRQGDQNERIESEK